MVSVITEKGKIMEDKKDCVSMNYEAEYERVSRELEKAYAENRYLRDELKQKEGELSFHYGFKTAVELICGRGGCNG